MYIHLHRRSSLESDSEPLYEYDRAVRLAGVKLKRLLAGIFVACCIIAILVALCVMASKIGKGMDKTVTINLNTSPLVNTSCGDVQGLIEDGIYVFRGIPFAMPPVNVLRWKPPVPLKTGNGCWKETYRAFNFGPSCYQYNPYFRHEEGSEDCLFVNIWTPDLDGATEVMVYFHGGQLLYGSGSDPGESPTTGLARASNMVLVSFNYRLGAFGFLTLETLTWPSLDPSSNYGFWDQIAALRWVKENIVNFGGDPDKVTVFGHGSGATSILALLSTTQTQGLFHRAWLMSPSARLKKGIQEAKSDNCAFLNASECLETNYRRHLPSCERADVHQSFSCLHRLNVEEIIRASPLDVFPFWGQSQVKDLPTPDEHFGALAIVDEQLLRKPLPEAWQSGFGNDVPVLIGNVPVSA